MATRPLAPLCLVIAGPNGAGKSTFAREYVMRERGLLHFINADLIAAGLSPLKPELAAVRAGRLLLKEFARLAALRASFALETTLSGLTYLAKFRRLKTAGYRIELIYLDLDRPVTAIRRVRARVKEGGHDVPEADIKRRFFRSRQNFGLHYQKLADAWWHYDNSATPPRLLAHSARNET
jgi:predicted ABC-type ATPase